MSKYGTKGKGIRAFLITAIGLGVLMLVTVVTLIITKNLPKYEKKEEGLDLKKTFVERNKAKPM